MPKPETIESPSPFAWPKTLDEVLLLLALIAWPAVFQFILLPDFGHNPVFRFFCWVGAIVAEAGLFVALQTVRQHATLAALEAEDWPTFRDRHLPD